MCSWSSTIADGFPTGARLDALVLWTLAQIEAAEPTLSVYTPTVLFYALREHDMTWASNEQHYYKLVDRSLDRLRGAGLIESDDGWRLRRIEPL